MPAARGWPTDLPLEQDMAGGMVRVVQGLGSWHKGQHSLIRPRVIALAGSATECSHSDCMQAGAASTVTGPSANEGRAIAMHSEILSLVSQHFSDFH